MAAPSRRRSFWRASSARRPGPTWTSPALRSARRRAKSTRAGVQAGACACSTIWWPSITRAVRLKARDGRRCQNAIAGCLRMTEFLFYHLQGQPVERVLPALLEKSIERGWRVAVHTSSEERVDALDAHLWTFREDSFLPHGTFREPTAADQPVLLTVNDHNPN